MAVPWIEDLNPCGVSDLSRHRGHVADSCPGGPFSDWVAQTLQEEHLQQGRVLEKGTSASTRIAKPRLEYVGMIPRLPDSLLDGSRWRRVTVGRWQKPLSIHNKEARAALPGLKREARNVTPYNTRLLSLGYNLAGILAFDRGRARDAELRALCRQSAAVQLATGIQWKRRYVETDRGISDADSP